MPRLAIALLVAFAAALTATVCGEDTGEQNDYVDEVNAVTTDLNGELSRISSEVTSISDPAEAADVFARFSESLQSAAEEIGAIDPPDDVSDLHDRLADEVETLSAEATNVVDEIREGGPVAVIGVATGFIADANRISSEIDSTIDEINSTLQD